MSITGFMVNLLMVDVINFRGSINHKQKILRGELLLFSKLKLMGVCVGLFGKKYN
jgi:hypothetical protein